MRRFRLLALVAVVLAPLGCLRVAPPPTEASVEENRAARADAGPPVPPSPPVGEPEKRISVAPLSHKPGAAIPERVLDLHAGMSDEWPDRNLLNEDPGLDSKIESALEELNRLDKATVDEKIKEDDIGFPDAPNLDPTALSPPGLASADPAPPGAGSSGPKSGAGEKGLAAFPDRDGATRSRLRNEGGGNEPSERAVALGLAWLAKQQKADGSWVYDQGHKEEVTAATGMALLAFLGAGETHKPAKDKDEEKRYAKTVDAGLKFLMKTCPTTGPAAGRLGVTPERPMYAQGIATVALCEAYGMTKDPVLKPYAQAAINYIQRAQGRNGSWGYKPGDNGDTSILGWQVQALHAAKLAGLVVDDRVLKRAVGFLNSVAAGTQKSRYGYVDNSDAKAGTAMTAAGLLCRYNIDGWGPSKEGMIDGVKGLMTKPPAGTGGMKDMYYYYYATQVVHFCGEDDWKTWNEGSRQDDGTRKGGMRDWLVGAQIQKDDAKGGSWDPEAGHFGSGCGRLGTTAMCVLTLEVYYRYLPLYKRGPEAEDGAKNEPKK